MVDIYELNSDIVAIQCTKCKFIKLKSDFYREPRGFAGIRSICKKCDKARRRQNYKKQPEPANKKRGKKKKLAPQEQRREAIVKEIRRIYRKGGKTTLDKIMIYNPPLYMQAVAHFHGWDNALKEILGDEIEE
ncbi:hypothetical protein ABES25_06065 [Bacillus gobiensis]|uniref:hypothetical protein n=1 Tax=Bacillus gobiensis TaxID=1441095 RepID=UPI003D1B303B